MKSSFKYIVGHTTLHSKFCRPMISNPNHKLELYLYKILNYSPNFIIHES